MMDLWVRSTASLISAGLSVTRGLLRAGIDFVFPFVKSLRPGSAAELLAIHGLKPGLCMTHVAGHPIGGLSMPASHKLMTEAGRPLVLTFRPVPSPWLADDGSRPGAPGTPREAMPEPEPEPEPGSEGGSAGSQPVQSLAIDESVEVGAGSYDQL